MQVIVKARRCGKTWELLERVKAYGGVIVCADQRQKVFLNEQAKIHGLENIAFTWKEITQNKANGHKISHAYIDNADMVLQSLTTIPIEAVTFTED